MKFPFEFSRFDAEGTEFSDTTIVPEIEEVAALALDNAHAFAHELTQLAGRYAPGFIDTSRTAEIALNIGGVNCRGSADLRGLFMNVANVPDRQNLIALERYPKTWHGMSFFADEAGTLLFPLTHFALSEDGSVEPIRIPEDAVCRDLSTAYFDNGPDDNVNAYFMYSRTHSDGTPRIIRPPAEITTDLPTDCTPPTGWGESGDTIAMPYAVGHEIIAQLAGVRSALDPATTTHEGAQAAIDLLQGPLELFCLEGWVETLENHLGKAPQA